MPYKNKDDKRKNGLKRYARDKEVIKRKNRNYYHKYRERLRKRRLELAPIHRLKSNERERLRYALLRQEILNAYGRKCACCGEKEVLFLELDHVNNDGKAHRAKLKSNGSKKTYRDLKERGFPKQGFQLLCSNCNQGKKRNGGTCPHKTKNQ